MYGTFLQESDVSFMCHAFQQLSWPLWLLVWVAGQLLISRSAPTALAALIDRPLLSLSLHLKHFPQSGHDCSLSISLWPGHLHHLITAFFIGYNVIQWCWIKWHVMIDMSFGWPTQLGLNILLCRDGKMRSDCESCLTWCSFQQDLMRNMENAMLLLTTTQVFYTAQLCNIM